MKKINVIMHYPNEELVTEYIIEATTQTYLKAVIKVINKSSLTINEKKDLINKKITSNKSFSD